MPLRTSLVGAETVASTMRVGVRHIGEALAGHDDLVGAPSLLAAAVGGAARAISKGR